MSLQSELISINRMHANEPNVLLPYTLEDVRWILFQNTKFNKNYTFNGILPSETVSRLRTEGLSVELTENNHTVVSWQIR